MESIKVIKKFGFGIIVFGLDAIVVKQFLCFGCSTVILNYHDRSIMSQSIPY